MEKREILCRDLKSVIHDRLSYVDEITDEEVLEQIDNAIVNYGKERYIAIEERENLRKELFNSIRKLDILQELIEYPDITEIMVNGTENIFYEKDGKIYEWTKRFGDKERIHDIAHQIAGKVNRIINEASPIVDARLEDGSRVNVVLDPIAINGPAVTIRRFPKNPLTMEDLIRMNSISKEAAEFLKKLVVARYNIFISGGTGSGKTSFLNILSNYIPKGERVLTIEDSAELQIKNVPNLVRMETRNANTEGENAITIRDLIKTSLRMRPDRIIVGETRGSEAVDMLQAMNTGHDGSLSTGHGNSPLDMLARLETMVLMGLNIPLEAIRRQIASGIDIIIHLGRLRDRTRRVMEINEIAGIEEGEYVLNTLYKFSEIREVEGEVEGILERTGEIRNSAKLHMFGVIEEEIANDK